MSAKSYRRAIELAGSGTKFPVMQMVRQDAGMAATIAKLIPSQHPVQYKQSGDRETTQPNLYDFRKKAETTAQNVNDAETVMQLLPDMELAQQILVSSVGSPKDMMSLELTYTPPSGLMASDLAAALVEMYRQHFETVHKIKDLIPQILRDVLFATGSYVMAVIPENSIDEVINGQQRLSMESLAEHVFDDGTIRPIGLLGPSVKSTPTVAARSGISLESFSHYNYDTNKDMGQVRFEHAFKQALPLEDVFLTVTDNPTLLKIPQVNQKIREQRIFSAMGSRALESIGFGREAQSIDRLNDRELTGILYKNKTFGYQPVATLKTQEQLSRRTVGNPMVMHIPSEAVIPVHVPGSPKHQIGIFVLVDMDGHPVVRQEITDHYQQQQQRMNSSGAFPSAMLNKVKGQMSGFDLNNRDHLDYSSRVYGEMVEQDLLARFRNGAYGSGIELAKREEIYRIMFARALAKQHTQLLFIPAEFMTYFALRFNQDGIGESLLDQMKILNSLRSMLLFANVMAGIKNSIGRTEVKLKFDEDDQDPRKTAEIAMNEIIGTRQGMLPIGRNSPSEVVDFITRAGFEFTFEGHPGMPDVSIDFGEKNSNYTKPDTELEDNLRKRAIMKTGIPPETVDAAYQPELATSVVTNNILLSKRVMQIQDEFHPQLASHLRIHAMNSEDLMERMKKTLSANFKKIHFSKADHAREGVIPGADGVAADHRAGVAVVGEPAAAEPNITPEQKEHLVQQVLVEFLMNIEVSLPRPNSSTLENQVTALETYVKALDIALEAWLSDKFFTNETGGDIAAQVLVLKEVVKAYYVRQWMAENGMMTELAQLTAVGEDGKPVVDVFKAQSDHIARLQETFGDFFADLVGTTNKANDKFKETQGKSNTEASSGSDFGGTSDNGGDQGGGGDPFPDNGGIDKGGDAGGGLGDMPDFGGDAAASGGDQGGEGGDNGGNNEPATDNKDANNPDATTNDDTTDNNDKETNTESNVASSNADANAGNTDADTANKNEKDKTDEDKAKDKDKDEKDKGAPTF